MAPNGPGGRPVRGPFAKDNASRDTERLAQPAFSGPYFAVGKMAVKERTVDKETAWNHGDRLKFAEKPLSTTLSLWPYVATASLFADPEASRVGMQGELVPEHGELPKLVGGGGFDPQGAESGYFGGSLLSDRLRLMREMNREGVKDTLTGEAGPFKGFYSTSEGYGKAEDPRTKALGLSVKAGPATLFGERTDTSWEGRHPGSGRLLREAPHAKHMENTRFDRRVKEAGAKIELPVRRGLAALKAVRKYMRTLSPSGKGESRYMHQAPNVTSVGGSWKGPVGPGTLGVSGGADFIQGIGTSPHAKGSYAMEDPFGLGGTLEATGTWANPLGESSDFETWLRYKLRR